MNMKYTTTIFGLGLISLASVSAFAAEDPTGGVLSSGSISYQPDYAQSAEEPLVTNEYGELERSDAMSDRVSKSNKKHKKEYAEMKKLRVDLAARGEYRDDTVDEPKELKLKRKKLMRLQADLSRNGDYFESAKIIRRELDTSRIFKITSPAKSDMMVMEFNAMGPVANSPDHMSRALHQIVQDTIALNDRNGKLSPKERAQLKKKLNNELYQARHEMGPVKKSRLHSEKKRSLAAISLTSDKDADASGKPGSVILSDAERVYYNMKASDKPAAKSAD